MNEQGRAGLWQLTRQAFHAPGTRIYRVVQGVVWTLIAFSVSLLLVDLASTSERRWLERIDQVVLWLFVIEIVLRILTFRPASLDLFERTPLERIQDHLLGRFRYCLRPLTLIDILTVVALVPGLRGLRALRFLRLVRTTPLFRYATPFVGIERAFRDNSLLFAFAFGFLGMALLVGGVSLYLVERGTNPEIQSLTDGLWWALVTLTTVGFGDITPITGVGRAIGSVLMIIGMFNLAMFAGIVGRTLVDSVLSMKQEQFRMSDYVDHIVVCGYDSGAAMLLDALAEEVDLEQQTVVIFAPGERPMDVGPDFIWVNGNPTKESELDKARLTHAKAAILVGPRDESPQAADATTLLTIFTLRSYMKKKSRAEAERQRPLYVVAEILDAENVEHARAAGADEVIESTRLGFSLMAHAIFMPGAARIVSQVGFTGTQSVFVGELPTDIKLPTSFGELAARLKKDSGVMLLGLRDPQSRVDQVNPPDEASVEPGIRLVYLAAKPVLSLPAVRYFAAAKKSG